MEDETSDKEETTTIDNSQLPASPTIASDSVSQVKSLPKITTGKVRKHSRALSASLTSDSIHRSHNLYSTSNSVSERPTSIHVKSNTLPKETNERTLVNSNERQERIERTTERNDSIVSQSHSEISHTPTHKSKNFKAYAKAKLLAGKSTVKRFYTQDDFDKNFKHQVDPLANIFSHHKTNKHQVGKNSSSKKIARPKQIPKHNRTGRYTPKSEFEKSPLLCLFGLCQSLVVYIMYLFSSKFWYEYVLLNLFPIIETIKTYKANFILGDISAGLTVGIMHLPQGMAYAMLANLPPVNGSELVRFISRDENKLA